MCVANMSPCRHIAPIRALVRFIWEKHQIKRASVEVESNVQYVCLTQEGAGNTAAGLYPVVQFAVTLKPPFILMRVYNKEVDFLLYPS